MTLSKPVQLAVATLAEVRRTGTRCAAPENAWGLASLDDAFAVQRLTIASLGGVKGWKVSIAKPVDTGAPFAKSMVVGSGEPLPILLPGTITVELEIAVVLAKDLPLRDEPYTRAELMDAIGTVHAALEIVQPRFVEGTKASKLCSVADLLGAGALVLGTGTQAWHQLEFAALAVELWVDGDPVTTAPDLPRTADVLEAVLWLANQARSSDGLRAGQPIITGARLKRAGLPQSIEISGTIQQIGAVAARF